MNFKDSYWSFEDSRTGVSERRGHVNVKQAVLVDDAQFVDVVVEEDVQSERALRAAGAAGSYEEPAVDPVWADDMDRFNESY